jgi:hypothetical protein
MNFSRSKRFLVYSRILAGFLAVAHLRAEPREGSYRLEARAAGGHNYINWRGSLADGLIYLSESGR